MAKKEKIRSLKCVCLVLLLMVTVWGMHAAQAEPIIGKTYDQSNYQEIEDYLSNAVLFEVKKGDIIVKVGELDYELKMPDSDIKKTQKNEGLYYIDEDGLLIKKETGNPPKDLVGLPFPTIDPKDPKVAAKIAENFRYRRCQSTSVRFGCTIFWVGKGGVEREITPYASSLFYQARQDGALLPNPRNFFAQMLSDVKEPFAVRGARTMNWEYNDARETSSFSYVPMLRRVLRLSSAARSDPFFGSDAIVDDADGYCGKNADMEWSLVGEKKILAVFTRTNRTPLTKTPIGSYLAEWDDIKCAWEVPGSPGAPWAPQNVVWVLRPMWILQMDAKDPYYNIGRQFLYMDRDAYGVYFKEGYDRSGEYWRNYIQMNSFWVNPEDDYRRITNSAVLQLDDRAPHASQSKIYNYSDLGDLNIQAKWMNGSHFNMTTLIQGSK